MTRTQTSNLPPVSLRDMVCAVHGCSREEFASRMLRLCVHRRAVPFVGLIQRAWPKFFQPDLELIQDTGDATRINEILTIVNSYRNDCLREQRFFHDQLRLRISGRRLYQVYTRTRQRYEHHASPA